MLVQGFMFSCNISVLVGLAGMACSSMEEETVELFHYFSSLVFDVPLIQFEPL